MQAAVFAAVLMLVAWGIISYIESYMAGTDVRSVSVEVLKSAYVSRDANQSFTREAKLMGQGFSNESLRNSAGIPKGTIIRIFCNESFCENPCHYYSDKSHWNNHCGDQVTLKKGGKIKVCASCKTYGTTVKTVKCGLFLDADTCNIYMP